MAFKIPFTKSNINKLKKRSEFLKKYFKHKKNSKLQIYLTNADSNITREEYLAISVRATVIFFFSSLIFFSLLLSLAKREFIILLPLAISGAVSLFILISQINYPKMYENRKAKEIENNLIPALQDMLVQLNSGVPLYSILVNISSSDYGALSEEFKKAVKKINAGYPQIEVLESIGEKSSSLYFKRYLWQLSNGMRAGSDISVVIRSSIRTLNEEQLIQIQNYGNKLNPFIMFYMLISVILPALSITFLTIVFSMIGVGKTTANLLYFALMGAIIFIQIMFMGVIKSIRPSLL